MMRPTPMLRFVIAWMLAAALPAVEYVTLAEEIKRAFPDSGTVEEFPLAVTPEQHQTVQAEAKSSARGALAKILVGHSNGKLDGVAFIDNVIGRTEAITFACVLGADGRVRRLDVMIYREPVGAQVRDERFLRQYVGKGPEDPVRRDRDIANIGGATMSVDALTERVRYFLDLYAMVLKEQIALWLNERASAPGGAAKDVCEGAAAIGNSALSIRIKHDGSGQARDRLQQAIAAALERAKQDDAIVNSWNKDSELARLNTAGAIVASPDLLSAVTAAREFWTMTDGRFDPSVGPLVQAWKKAAEQQRLMTAAQVEELRSVIGFSRVAVDGTSISLPKGGTLDLGGMNKGWILDRCAGAVKTALAGEESAVLVFGDSSMLALGSPSALHEVEIRDPANPQRLARRVALQPNQGFGYSSGVGRTFLVGDKAYSHLIDPLTGQPGPLDSAAVVLAPSAALADGLDTALCLMNIDDAVKFLAQHPEIQALLWDGQRFRPSAQWPGMAP